MTTASGGVAVIAADVARTDRRALSEAWYSALHVARAGTPAPAHTRPHAPASGSTPRTSPRVHGPSAAPSPAPQSRRLRAIPRSAAAPAASRSQAQTETSRRIERAVTALAGAPRSARAQTIEVAGGRVRLLVRSDGGTTRVVALCSAALREPVERALAGARYALATGGA
jgi:hypothetical protein